MSEPLLEHVIANKNGLLFEKENAQDLADKLSMLIQHPSLISELSRDMALFYCRGPSFVEENCQNDCECVHALPSLQSLLQWELDVLPSVIEMGKLTGVPLGIGELRISSPFENLSWLSGNSSRSEQWQLSSGSIDLTPSLSVQLKIILNLWSEQVPIFTELTLREGHWCQDDLRVPTQHDLMRPSPTIFLCDETTTESELHFAVRFGSILVAERTANLHGYVGVITEIEHLFTIVEAILNEHATHRHQRQENWRRRLMKLHPWLRLVESAYDRSHLRRVDPLRYDVRPRKQREGLQPIC